MDEIKKPKIVVIGVGSGGSRVVDNLSQITNESIKFVKVDYSFDNENTNATQIKLPHFRPRKSSMEEVSEYLEKKGHTEKLAKLVSMIRDGDELYRLISHGDIVSTMGFRLKRDGEIIIQCLEEH